MKKPTRGMSIVEIIIALALSLVVVGLASTLFLTFFRNYSSSFGNTQAVTATQQAITQLGREIRELDTAETGAWPIVEADDNSITFYSDITNDGQTDLVRYFLEGATLKRTLIEPSGDPPSYPVVNEKTRTVADNVILGEKPLFTYYNGNWPSDEVNNPLTGPSRISATRYIEIYLRLVGNPENPEDFFESKTGIQLRNLKDNL
jgi:type II secretory pathway pseudopilin PulG